jgi:hypothetical protein
LCDVIRRSGRKLPILGVATASVALLALSGCSTVTDGSVVARVDDAELSDDQLSTMLTELTGDDDAATAPADLANQLITTFILDEALRNDLAATGAPHPDADPDAELTAAGLDAAANEAFTAWQTLPPPEVDEATLEARYSAGPVE